MRTWQNPNIIKHQRILRNDILHQRYAVSQSGPWLILNEAQDIYRWYTHHSETKDHISTDGEYSFFHFYGWIFIKTDLIWGVHIEPYLQDISFQTWINQHHIVQHLNEWYIIKDENRKIHTEYLPYHVGWKKESNEWVDNVTDEQRSFSYIFKNNKQWPLPIDSTGKTIFSHKDFIFLFQPIRGYVLSQCDWFQRAITYSYSNNFQQEAGTNSYFLLTKYSNPLFIGSHILHKSRGKTDICQIYCPNIWDGRFIPSDFKYNSYVPYYEKTFPKMEGYYWQNNEQIYEEAFVDVATKEVVATVKSANTHAVQYNSPHDIPGIIRII